MSAFSRNHEPKLSQIQIDDPFWTPRQTLAREVVIPYQEKVLNDEIDSLPESEMSHAIRNFRIAAGLEEGEFHGMVFQDSDVAKWLEGVAGSLAISRDPALEERADRVIELLALAQQPDGYLNTYFTIKCPERRFTDLQECHELYCAGHMMEAACAYYEATGKDRFLKIMMRMADCIIDNIGPEEGKIHGVPGHEEVEIGLLRLYRATGEKRYLDQAAWFINERGKDPDIFEKEAKRRGWYLWGNGGGDRTYTQVHAPVRMQTKARGHSVRAMYLYTAMADLALETGDDTLLKACRTLWDNVTKAQMYITGGIGQIARWEGFGTEYELPSDTVYAETCASIGLVFFARKLLEHSADGSVADVMEQALFNGVLSGMQLDGKSFFYVNPLEVIPGVSGVFPGYEHVLSKRPRWYACACCPPNVVRLLTSLGRYAYGENPEERVIFAHLFAGGRADLENATVTVESSWPWKGDVKVHVRKKDPDKNLTFALRIPAYVTEGTLSAAGETCSIEALRGRKDLFRDGYAYISCNEEETDILFRAELPVRRIYASPKVRAAAGKCALKRGPLVYCFEQADNGERLWETVLEKNASFTVKTCEEGALKGMLLIETNGLRQAKPDSSFIPECGDDPGYAGALYGTPAPVYVPQKLTAVPYFAWGNRKEGGMQVWIREGVGT